MAHEIERRTWGELRVARDEEGGPRIVGYAAIFGSPSEDLGGFREVVKAGAFDRAVREGHDVRALVNHDPNLILGRTKSETLKLSIDETGLRAEIFPPDTTAARDVLTSIARGDVSGMSFAFQTLTDDWRTQDGEVVRELKDLVLYDVSAVAFPAYPETQVKVSARALERARAERPPAGVPMELNELQQRQAEA